MPAAYLTVRRAAGLHTTWTHTAAFTVTFWRLRIFCRHQRPGRFDRNPGAVTVTADNHPGLYADPNRSFHVCDQPAFVMGDDISVGSGAQIHYHPNPVSPVALSPSLCAIVELFSAHNLRVRSSLHAYDKSAPCMLNVDSVSCAYGDPNPTFTGTDHRPEEWAT